MTNRSKLNRSFLGSHLSVNHKPRAHFGEFYSVARSIEQWPARVPRTAFIVDDHPIFREGLTQVINAEKDLRICGTAGTAAEAIKKIRGLKPDLVLVDISLPDRSGLELIKQLRADHPNVKLLVVSMHDEALYANRVLEMGGDGYIMKQEDPAEIVHAMRDVLDGHIYVSEQVLDGRPKMRSSRRQGQPARPLGELSDQELEVLELLGQSLEESEIAEKLNLDLELVAASVASIQRKLRLKSHNAVVRYAVCWVATGAA